MLHSMWKFEQPEGAKGYDPSTGKQIKCTITLKLNFSLDVNIVGNILDNVGTQLYKYLT